MGLKNALIYSVLGILVVFFALVLLLLIIKVLVKVVPAEEESKKDKDASSAIEPAKAVAVAPGSAGEIALNGVDPGTAAMCMAIIADELGKPLNELRFKYIKECKDEV